MTERATADPKAAERPRRKRRLGLSEHVLIGLALGVAVGIFFGEMVGWLGVVGDVFVNLLQITVIPYISLSLVVGLAGLSYAEVRELALKGGTILLLLWTLTLLVIALMPLSFPPWPSASFFSKSLIEEAKAPDFLRLFIPSNPFYSYANAVVPAVVVFSILIGFALIGVTNKNAILEPLSAVREALIRATGIIAKLAPVGVFALIANAVGTTPVADLARLQVYIVLFALTSLALGLWVLPALVTVVTPLRYWDVARTLRTPLITAFATGSSLIVLPMLIERCRALLAEAQVFRGAEQEHADSAVEVLIPTFFTFPNPAVLLSLSFIMFAGWFVGTDVPLAQFPQLFLVGVPSLFGGTLIAIPFLLDLMRLPSDLFETFVFVDVFNSRFGSFLSAMYFATVGLLGTMALAGKLQFRWIPLARYALVTTLLIAAVLGGVRAFYSNVVVASFTKDDVLRSLRLVGEPQPAKVFGQVPPGLEGAGGEPAGFAEIIARGLLRVCYRPGTYPSAFYNSADPPELVGFDIEMAHWFARSRKLTLEFLPTSDERQAAALLDAGACDIYMKTLPISAERTQTFGMTDLLFRSSVGLIVRDYRRGQFRTWEGLRARGTELRLALPSSVESQPLMRSLLPDATYRPIGDMAEQERILSSGAEDVDAVADIAEEGAAWTILHPEFSVVVPKPTVFLPVAYAVARKNRDLLVAFNAWLAAEKAKGTVDKLYNYWMLGRATKSQKPPRWSVIRNVLGWRD